MVAPSETENGIAMPDPLKLRDLAAWFRAFAEQAGSPAIWDARLRTAENLETEAELVENRLHSQEAGSRDPRP